MYCGSHMILHEENNQGTIFFSFNFKDKSYAKGLRGKKEGWLGEAVEII